MAAPNPVTWIPELGMYYYKARLYAPTLGRFMQVDPVGYKDQINLYEYAGDDPVDGRDPSGLEPCPPKCTGSRVPGVSSNPIRVYPGAAQKQPTSGANRASVRNGRGQTAAGMARALTYGGDAHLAATTAGQTAALAGANGAAVADATGKAFLPAAVVLAGASNAANATSHVQEGSASPLAAAGGALVKTTLDVGIPFAAGVLASAELSPAGGIMVGAGTSVALEHSGMTESIARNVEKSIDDLLGNK